ncbi:galacturonan 1,4-alpha-galacturonidase [Salvia divinorum]|uniref:Galacturonan 1,4-alpha-galacturonidase n=1 Tax=Salvia divinorum TaxID=28513 RepID=A0ABD1H6I1_SALDI
MKAWKDAMASTVASQVLIPRGDWTLSQADMSGPNKAPINLEVKGNLKAYPDLAAAKSSAWIRISKVDSLTISGGGVLDGQGQETWKRNDCGTNKACVKPPINLFLKSITNSIIHDITTKDSKFFHANCVESRNVTFQRFTVSAPGDSKNTDGLHMARSNSITVIDSVIGTGDDCISMGDGLSNIIVKNITCGPGHGISIGSLGKYTYETDVKGIRVEGCTLSSTTNGIRIKTFPSSPIAITVSDIHFVGITMVNVSRPIIFDQEYCPGKPCPVAKPSQIKISDVEIAGITGTSATSEVVTFVCSKDKPCDNIRIGAIDLKYIGKKPKPVTTRCQNIKPIFTATQNPPICSAPRPSTT